jgi:hypothetical protein
LSEKAPFSFAEVEIFRIDGCGVIVLRGYPRLKNVFEHNGRGLRKPALTEVGMAVWRESERHGIYPFALMLQKALAHSGGSLV